jgi:hypothetical protein
MSMSRIAGMVLVLPLLAALAGEPADDKVDNPMYLTWSAFKAGTWVRFSSTTRMNGARTELEITTRLVEITPERAVLEIHILPKAMPSGAGKPLVQTQIAAARVGRTEVAQRMKEKADAETVVGSGEEELSVGGQSIRCQRVETVARSGGSEIRSTIWSCDQVPGAMVRMRTTIEGGSDTMMQLIEMQVLK